MTNLTELFELPAATDDIPNSHIVDGIAICNDCNTPKQCVIKWFGKETKQNCMCDCEKAAYEKEQETLKKNFDEAEINHNRSIGLRTGSYSYTFENANVDAENEKVLQLCESYADNFDQFLAKNIGLKLWGNVGRGKSFAANCIANRLIDKGYRVYYITAGQLVNTLQKTFEKNEYIDDICDYDLLIIDDLGAERDTPTAAQYIEDVIDRRITRNKPLVITTNITEHEYVDIKEERLYSRLDAMCQPIKCVGSDRRKGQHSDKAEDFKRIMIEGLRKRNEKDMQELRQSV